MFVGFAAFSNTTYNYKGKDTTNKNLSFYFVFLKAPDSKERVLGFIDNFFQLLITYIYNLLGIILCFLHLFLGLG